MQEHLTDICLAEAKKKGAEYCEVRVEETSTNGFLIKNGLTQIAGFDKLTGLGVRFLINGKLGFFSTNHLEKENICKQMNLASRMVKKSKQSEAILISAEKTSKASYKVKQKKNIEDMDTKDKISFLFELEKELTSFKEKSARYLSLSDSVTEKIYANSEGSIIKSTIPRINFYYYLTVFEHLKSSQHFWQYGRSSGYEALDLWMLPELLHDEMKETIKNLRDGTKAPKGIMDVVVAPQVTGIMVHESAGHPYEADRILGREAAQAGESFIKSEMLGTKIGNSCVTVADDPTLENSYGFYLYDDEGVKANRKFLIKNGIINEFLHNRSTAKDMKIKSNGSARAVSYDRETIVRMSNTFLLPGDETEEELIEGVKNGIYMKDFTEWNIDDVRLNQKYVGAHAYLIQNGEITRPVRNPTIEITTPQLWGAVDAVANNTEYHSGTCGKGEPMQAIPVFFGGPSFRLRNIRMR